MTVITARSPETILDAVRAEVARYAGKKKSHVTLQTRLSALEDDAIFNVFEAMVEIFGIVTPEDDEIEGFTKCNVRSLVEYITDAPLKRAKAKKVVSNKSKKVAQDPDKKPSGKKLKYPELATPVKFDYDGMAAEIADRAIEQLKCTKSVLFSQIDNELQCRDPKTDAVIGIVELIINHRQVGFNLLHFQNMAETLGDTVTMFSFSLGTPHMLRTRFEMAQRMRIDDRPHDLEEWVIDTLHKRVMFFPKIAPLLKKLVGVPKAGHVHIVAEIAMIVGAEFEDSVFDVYTNINKMEPGDEEALEYSLDEFFTQQFEVEDYAPKVAKKCKVAVTPPSQKMDSEEDEDEGVDQALNDALDDFRHLDLLNGVPTEHIVDLYLHVYDERTYMELLVEDLPVSQARSKMIDTLVRDHSINELATIARRSSLAKVIQIGEMLKVNVV